MDCYYYCQLKDKLNILNATSEMFTQSNGWNNCCVTPENTYTSLEAYWKLKNLACGVFQKKDQNSTIPHLNAHNLYISHGNLSNKVEEKDYNDDHEQDSSNMKLDFLFSPKHFLFLLFFCFIIGLYRNKQKKGVSLFFFILFINLLSFNLLFEFNF